MRKRFFLKLIKIALAMYSVIGLILFFTQELFLFHGKKLPANYAYNFKDQKWEEYNITRKDGTNLNFVKFLPNDTSIKGIVIYYHGNMQNINRYAPYTRFFTINGYEVWMMDYPGFGKTTGKLSEKKMKDDAQVIYDLVRNKIPATNILIYGKSMGTGLATYIASKNECKRVLLETPYYSLPTIYDDFTLLYPTNLMLRFRFPNYKYIPQIKAPITIFHGTKDKLIKYSNVSRLKPLLKPTDEFVTIQKATHNNIINYQLYTEKVDSLLSEY
jgi:uncharacterized protein